MCYIGVCIPRESIKIIRSENIITGTIREHAIFAEYEIPRM